MKNAILATGAAFVLAVLLSSPTFAQTNARPNKAEPAPAPVIEASADTPLDGLIDEAMTPEDRARMLLRCIGPAPRPLLTTRAEQDLRASEPAVIVSAESASPSR